MKVDVTVLKILIVGLFLTNICKIRNRSFKNRKKLGSGAKVWDWVSKRIYEPKDFGFSYSAEIRKGGGGIWQENFPFCRII